MGCFHLFCKPYIRLYFVFVMLYILFITRASLLHGKPLVLLDILKMNDILLMNQKTQTFELYFFYQ